MAHRRPGTGRAHLTPLNDTDLCHLDYDQWYNGTFHDLPTRHWHWWTLPAARWPAPRAESPAVASALR